MHKIKLTFAAAALCGGLLTLSPMSAAFAVPVVTIGKAANANDPRSTIRYYHHRHHRHCWWRYGHRHCRWW
jgi:hypothetical protein